MGPTEAVLSATTSAIREAIAPQLFRPMNIYMGSCALQPVLLVGVASRSEQHVHEDVNGYKDTPRVINKYGPAFVLFSWDATG